MTTCNSIDCCFTELRVKQTPTPLVEYSAPELEYKLLSNFSDVFWCDPDFYPVARQGQEETNAQEQFPAIRTNKAEFSEYWRTSGCRNGQIPVEQIKNGMAVWSLDSSEAACLLLRE